MTSWLHQQRLEAVLDAVRACGAVSVLDLGCGDGDLLVRLVCEPNIGKVVGVDLDSAALDDLRARLAGPGLEQAGATVEIIHGSIGDMGRELAGFDCAVLVEAIEHIDPGHLSVIERSVFSLMRPTTVVATTPNADFNVVLGVPSHRFRHPDHRFEWGRSKFRQWAAGVGRRNGYRVACSDIAGHHPIHGGASQMAVFRKDDQPSEDQRSRGHTATTSSSSGRGRSTGG